MHEWNRYRLNPGRLPDFRQSFAPIAPGDRCDLLGFAEAARRYRELLSIDGETVWCNYLPSPDIKKQQNYFLRGNDDKPDCYVFNERFYVVASTGSYPVPTIIYYIREPRVLVSSGATGYQITTCELNAMFHYLICEMAAAKCWRMLGDESSIRKYENIMKLINDEIQGIAIGGMIAPDRKEVSD